MKQLLISLGVLLSLPSCLQAEVQCPDACFIEENINAFRGTGNGMEGTVSLEGQTWNFESWLDQDYEVQSVKNINPQISVIDENKCNYLLSPTNRDSDKEDVTLLLAPPSKERI